MPAIRANPASDSASNPKNNNPKGKNQYKDCPSADDHRIPELLASYHRQNITDRKRLSKLLLDEHGITMSPSTIARRKRELGLRASGRTTAELSDAVKRQLVKDQMDKDRTGRIGAKTVKTRIFEETGIDLTRDWIRNEMRLLAPVEFASRRPRHKAPGNASANQTRTSAARQRTTNSSNPQQPISPGRSGAHADFFAPPIPDDPFDDSDSENEPSATSFLEPEPGGPHLEPDGYPPLVDSPVQPIPSTNETPAPSIPAILDILSRETPKMISLTRLLGAVDLERLQGLEQVPPAAYGDVIKYMEAAALLERQLSRFASGLRSNGPRL